MVINMLNKITKYIDSINDWLGKLFSILIIPITLIVVYDVIMRKLFNAPTIWSFEIVKQLYAAHFMLLTPYALLHGSHVKIDVFYRLFNEKKQAIFNIVTYIIFFFPFTTILLWKGISFARTSWFELEVSSGFFSAPLYYVKSVIPIVAFLLIMQGFSSLIKNINALLRN